MKPKKVGLGSKKTTHPPKGKNCDDRPVQWPAIAKTLTEEEGFITLNCQSNHHHHHHHHHINWNLAPNNTHWTDSLHTAAKKQRQRAHMVAKPIQSIAKNIRCQHHKGRYLKLHNPVTIAHRETQSLKVASH